MAKMGKTVVFHDLGRKSVKKWSKKVVFSGFSPSKSGLLSGGHLGFQKVRKHHLLGNPEKPGKSPFSVFFLCFLVQNPYPG